MKQITKVTPYLFNKYIKDDITATYYKGVLNGNRFFVKVDVDKYDTHVYWNYFDPEVGDAYDIKTYINYNYSTNTFDKSNLKEMPLTLHTLENTNINWMFEDKLILFLRKINRKAGKLLIRDKHNRRVKTPYQIKIDKYEKHLQTTINKFKKLGYEASYDCINANNSAYLQISKIGEDNALFKIRISDHELRAGNQLPAGVINEYAVDIEHAMSIAEIKDYISWYNCLTVTDIGEMWENRTLPLN